MPYLIDKKAIDNSKLDKRFKIQPEQYEEIIELYASGDYSLRSLGKLYGVDKATISKIVNPKQAKRIAEQSIKSGIEYRERLKTDRDLKDKRNKQVQKHRKYKFELDKKGLIEDK